MANHILFIGGDQRQRNVTRALIPGRDYAGELSVGFCHPCWNSNWNKTIDAVKRRLSDIEVVVLTTDVHTRLGEEVRRLARQDGVHCMTVRARGRGAILRVIGTASALPCSAIAGKAA